MNRRSFFQSVAGIAAVSKLGLPAAASLRGAPSAFIPDFVTATVECTSSYTLAPLAGLAVWRVVGEIFPSAKATHCNWQVLVSGHPGSALIGPPRVDYRGMPFNAYATALQFQDSIPQELRVVTFALDERRIVRGYFVNVITVPAAPLSTISSRSGQ